MLTLRSQYEVMGSARVNVSASMTAQALHLTAVSHAQLLFVSCSSECSLGLSCASVLSIDNTSTSSLFHGVLQHNLRCCRCKRSSSGSARRGRPLRRGQTRCKPSATRATLPLRSSSSCLKKRLPRSGASRPCQQSSLQRQNRPSAARPRWSGCGRRWRSSGEQRRWRWRRRRARTGSCGRWMGRWGRLVQRCHVCAR
jgi:hypothetical protein